MCHSIVPALDTEKFRKREIPHKIKLDKSDRILFISTLRHSNHPYVRTCLYTIDVWPQENVYLLVAAFVLCCCVLLQATRKLGEGGGGGARSGYFTIS